MVEISQQRVSICLCFLLFFSQIVDIFYVCVIIECNFNTFLSKNHFFSRKLDLWHFVTYPSLLKFEAEWKIIELLGIILGAGDLINRDSKAEISPQPSIGLDRAFITRPK